MVCLAGRSRVGGFGLAELKVWVGIRGTQCSSVDSLPDCCCVVLEQCCWESGTNYFGDGSTTKKGTMEAEEDSSDRTATGPGRDETGETKQHAVAGTRRAEGRPKGAGVVWWRRGEEQSRVQSPRAEQWASRCSSGARDHSQVVAPGNCSDQAGPGWCFTLKSPCAGASRKKIHARVWRLGWLPGSGLGSATQLTNGLQPASGTGTAHWAETGHTHPRILDHSRPHSHQPQTHAHPHTTHRPPLPCRPQHGADGWSLVGLSGWLPLWGLLACSLSSLIDGLCL